jgi:hypothetical protein
LAGIYPRGPNEVLGMKVWDLTGKFLLQLFYFNLLRNWKSSRG